MRLTDLNPRFVNAGGEGVFHKNAVGERVPVPEREGVGINFDCPCGCDSKGYVGFRNPLDGGEAYDPRPGAQWNRTGETFEELTLTPSILRKLPHGCGWHGFITDGLIENESHQPYVRPTGEE